MSSRAPARSRAARGISPEPPAPAARPLETHTLATPVHGTYLVEPPPASAPRAAVVGFHGYGETAADHLAELRRLAAAARPTSDAWLLCAVQALHPFYKRTGEVVAGWMTRFDRDHAIADNVRYVTSVVDDLHRRHPTLERLAFAGFSQGVAMAWRATAASPRRVHALVVLAGDVPPDVAERDLRDPPPVLLGRGTGDEWYDDAKLRADLETLAGMGVTPEPLVFDGGHEWGDRFVRRAASFLAKQLGADDPRAERKRG